MTLVEFLRARLDEEEALARKAVIPAHTGSYRPHGELAVWEYERGGEVVYAESRREDDITATFYVAADGEGLTPAMSEDCGPHVAYWDPARVLAEVEAKRTIIQQHESWPVLVETAPELDLARKDTLDAVTVTLTQRGAWMTQQEYRSRFGDEPPTTPILRALALPYAAHPGYRAEWRP